MIIQSVVLEGFKTYKEKTCVEFSEGLNLLSGMSGKGKSTIFDLISLHLLDKSEMPLESNLNWDSNYFYTEVNFIHNNDTYKSILEYTKSDTAKVGKSTRKLYKNDMDTAIAENTNVKDYLAELFDPMTTDAGLFFKQDSRPFIDLTDSARLELLRKIQNADFSVSISEIETYIKEVNSKIIELDNKIYALENKAYDFKIISDIIYSDTQISEMEKECSLLSNDITKISELKKQKEEYSNKVKELNTSIASTTAVISSNSEAYNKKVTELATYESKGISEETNSLDLEINEIKNREVVDTSDSIKNTFSVSKNEIDSKIEELTNSKKNYPVTRLVKFDETKINEVYTEIATFKANKKTTTERLNLCKSGKCPTCSHEFTSDEITVYEKELIEIDWAIADQETKLKSIEEEKKLYDEKVKANDVNKEECAKIDKQIAIYSEKLSNFSDSKLEELLEAEKTRIAKEFENNSKILASKETQKSQLLNNFETKKELFKTEIARYKDIIDAKSVELSRLEKDKVEYENKCNAIVLTDSSEIESKYSELKSKIESYTRSVAINKANEEHNRLLTEQQNNDKTEYENILLEKNSCLLDKLNHETAKALLQKDFPNYLIGKNIKVIENSMNDFIESVYKPLYVELTNSKTGVPLLYGTGKRKINVKGGLSGAEKCIVQLAFNNIFNRKNKLEVMLIDEGDSATDDVTSQSLFEVLGSMLQEYKQMIVISHNNNMKDYMIANYNAKLISL